MKVEAPCPSPKRVRKMGKDPFWEISLISNQVIFLTRLILTEEWKEHMLSNNSHPPANLDHASCFCV